MPDSQPTVGIVVLSWNRRERVLGCIARLEKMSGPLVTVIVVDNASSDGSVEAIRALHPAVVLMPQAANLGFVGGVNAGLREARRLGLTYAWLLNDDTQVANDVLSILLTFAAAHPQFRLFSPVVRDDDVGRALQFANGIVDWKRSRLHDELPAERFDALVADGATPVVIGTALLVDLRVLATVDGFDPKFFAYWEDIDFCVRCRQSGHVAACVPQATVLHDSPDRDTRPPHYFYYMIRNEALFWASHSRTSLGWRRVWLYKALIWLGESRDRGHVEIVRACTDGLWDGLCRRSGQRDPDRRAPRWFARLTASHPHLYVLLLQGRLGRIVGHMRGHVAD